MLNYDYVMLNGHELSTYVLLSYVFTRVVCYSVSKAAAQFTLLCDLLKDLGLPLNQDKVTPPTKKLACLGIDIDINTNTMSIAQEKLQDIYEACVQASNKTYLSRQAS